MRSVAISAATSFTGLWIAREFARRGWKVHALCSEGRESYTGLRSLRLKLLEESLTPHFKVRSEDGSMARWIREHRPEIWVNHHHFMERFRSPDYDYARAMKVGVDPLKELVRELKEGGCQGIIQSATYFEPGLGAQDPSFKGTPYGLSKKAVWEALQTEARNHSVLLSRFVNPNPIGPFENEDRLIPGLIRNAFRKDTLTLKTPAAVGDQLPLPPLVDSYVKLAEDLLNGQARTASPSGLVCGVADFVSIVNRELIESRLGFQPCRVEIPSDAPKQSYGFRNPERESSTIDWPAVWDHYADWLLRTDSLTRFFN